MNNKNVLITGGLGFIGKHLVNKLLQEKIFKNIFVLDRFSAQKKIPDFWSNKVEIIWDDLATIKEDKLNDLTDNVDVIYHLAGVSGAEKSILNPIESLESNNLASLNLLKSIGDKDIHLIYSSSRLVYGETEKSKISEDHILEPKSIYGIHKQTVENYIKLYSNLNGFNFTILRISNPYGPTLEYNVNYGIINLFINEALKGNEINLYGGGEQLRDYIYIDDLTEILAIIGDSYGINMTYNVGSGEVISLNGMVDKIITLTGKGKVNVSPWNELSKFVETGDSILDLNNLSNSFNWNARYTLEEGLISCISENIKLNGERKCES
ncbi:NAD-dependent epimerase/dehydratase family protein [Shouchella miscanthi]|uniref:NAD-dependent epimerase/dehydratase family protein n=1 Tax=Shouchella miscanthi TaxID=2598861 RepID=A0ABU6NQR0_9BACI|nr:NAD-dependent epimerase/dehydratase family protein [Shouchella miscanthi]MED4130342.1 NAD-dependent epimerase/dehydratase family protein [Shouchella miscanthi]